MHATKIGGYLRSLQQLPVRLEFQWKVDSEPTFSVSSLKDFGAKDLLKLEAATVMTVVPTEEYPPTLDIVAQSRCSLSVEYQEIADLYPIEAVRKYCQKAAQEGRAAYKVEMDDRILEYVMFVDINSDMTYVRIRLWCVFIHTVTWQ